jgi:hypothetical protein
MTCRECCAGAALADAQRVINRPKAKKERIAFAPMNCRANGPGWDEPGPFLRAAGGGCKLPAVDMCGSQSADTIKMNFRSQAPQLVDLSGLGAFAGTVRQRSDEGRAVETHQGPNRLSDRLGSF